MMMGDDDDDDDDNEDDDDDDANDYAREDFGLISYYHTTSKSTHVMIKWMMINFMVHVSQIC